MKPQFTILLALFLLANAGYCQNNCNPISSFPWTESFEKNGTNIPLCWTQGAEYPGHWEWYVIDNSNGLPPKAHSGNSKASIALDCPSDIWHQADLISPVFDLSEINDPVLSFWRIALGRVHLGIFRIDSSGLISPIGLLISTNTSNWQQETIHLPNKSNHYQIMFFGIHAGGGYGELHLDDISISDGTQSVSPYHAEKYSIAPNPVRDFATISGISPQQLTLYDCQGKVILTQNNHSNVIDMSQLPQGLYFLHIISDIGTVCIQKLIKQ